MVTLDYDKAAHLYRRAGFGASQSEIEALVGLDAGTAADRFLDFRVSSARTNGADAEAAARAWLKRMLKKPPLQEKMTLFWHGHFANSIDKVDDSKLMNVQNGLFRLFATGNFKALVRAVTKDPAMLVFLDGQENEAGNPNENYARATRRSGGWSRWCSSCLTSRSTEQGERCESPVVASCRAPPRRRPARDRAGRGLPESEPVALPVRGDLVPGRSRGRPGDGLARRLARHARPVPDRRAGGGRRGRVPDAAPAYRLDQRARHRRSAELRL